SRWSRPPSPRRTTAASIIAIRPSSARRTTGSPPSPLDWRLGTSPSSTSAPSSSGRSEEHTSELQSRRDLVCRLLLEKKKKIESIIVRKTTCANGVSHLYVLHPPHNVCL